MIDLHRGPLSVADDWIAEQVDGLWEDWTYFPQVAKGICA